MLAKAEHRIGHPIKTGDTGLGEFDFLFENSAASLDRHADDLALNNCRVDGSPAIKSGVNVFYNNHACFFIQLDICDRSAHRSTMSTKSNTPTANNRTVVRAWDRRRS